MPNDDAPGMEDMVRWRDVFSALPFSHPDDFDQAIFDGVEVGYFDEERLVAEAKKLEDQMARVGRDNSFAQAWDAYHGSFNVADEAVLDRLYQGALENLVTIDPLNLNGTIRFLREFGRDAEADRLARDYVAAQPDDLRFFDLRYYHFSADAPPDPALVAAFEALRDNRKDDRDPGPLLLAIAGGQPWSDEDIRLLAGVTPDAFETMIVKTEGKDLRRLIQTALQIARHNAHDNPEFLASLSAALTRIAALSPMATRRLKAWGFTVAEAGGDEAPEAV